MILLGGSGYIGQAFASALRARGIQFLSLSRKEVDYTRFDVLLSFLKSVKPRFLINAAGYTGKPNVDACELDKSGTLKGNVLLPATIAHACEVANVPWGHVSSGCIYSGAKIVGPDGLRVCKDLMQPEIQSILKTQPDRVRGYTEADLPNFCFRDGPCSFYSGTKSLAEEAISGMGQLYIWRLRIPFDEFDNPRNYLRKLLNYEKVYDNVNSISHRADFANACLDLWLKNAHYGIYNVTNPGFVTTRQVVRLLEKKFHRKLKFWSSDSEFYEKAAKTPRSNCVLDVGRLLSAGIKMRPVEEALEESLRKWKAK